MRPLPKPLAALLAALLAIGCGDQGATDHNDETFALGTTAAGRKAWEPTPDEPVTLTMDGPGTARRGTPVHFRLTLHNGTERPIAVGLDQDGAYDVLVAQAGMRPDSGSVWSEPKAPRMTRQAVVTDPLRPGQDTTFEIVWPGTDDMGHTVPPGRYRARAKVTAELRKAKELWTAWVPIEIK